MSRVCSKTVVALRSRRRYCLRVPRGETAGDGVEEADWRVNSFSDAPASARDVVACSGRVGDGPDPEESHKRTRTEMGPTVVEGDGSALSCTDDENGCHNRQSRRTSVARPGGVVDRVVPEETCVHKLSRL